MSSTVTGDPGINFQLKTGTSSLLQNVQTSSVAHPDSYSMGTRGSFLGGKEIRA
jgi:hypothetical protein